MFAEVKCWCEHDCCEVTAAEDKKILDNLGISTPFYDCEVCECHGVSSPWDDLGGW